MQVLLTDRNGKSLNAEISRAKNTELKKLEDWNFNWFELAKSKKSEVYKLQTKEIEALLMIHYLDDEFFEMKNIEVAPSNYGSMGKYINAAQILMSYACLLSFEYNKGPYKGYLTFISKGRLIDYYIEKYNAELVFRERMQINPVNGMRLIKKHLNLEL